MPRRSIDPHLQQLHIRSEPFRSSEIVHCRLYAASIVFEKGDRDIAAVAKKASHGAGVVIVIDVEMLQKDVFVPTGANSMAVAPRATTDCAPSALFIQEKLKLLERFSVLAKCMPKASLFAL